MRYDVHGNRIVQINGPSDHEVYPTPDFVHLISPASGVTSTQIQITGFGERIARKKIQGPTLRTAWNTSPAFDPDVIGPLGGMALLGLLVWGARRGAFVLVVRRPGHAAASLAATLGLVVTPKVWAGGGGGPEIYWEIADPLGSGLLLIGENGLRAREFSFTPFGEPRNAVGGATSLRKNYAGHRYDEASGLVYMNARWYEPGSGRFMSVDPVLRTGAPQSHNAYSYVENNPIAANDPTGMCLRCFTDLWADTGWSMDIVTTTYSSNGANKSMTQIAQTTVTGSNDGGVVTTSGDQWTGYGPEPIPTSRAMSQRGDAGGTGTGDLTPAQRQAIFDDALAQARPQIGDHEVNFVNKFASAELDADGNIVSKSLHDASAAARAAPGTPINGSTVVGGKSSTIYAGATLSGSRSLTLTNTFTGLSASRTATFGFSSVQNGTFVIFHEFQHGLGVSAEGVANARAIHMMRSGGFLP